MSLIFYENIDFVVPPDFWKIVPKKYGAMLKKLKLAQKDIKRAKVNKNCKTQDSNHGTLVFCYRGDGMDIRTKRHLDRETWKLC